MRDFYKKVLERQQRLAQQVQQQAQYAERLRGLDEQEAMLQRMQQQGSLFLGSPVGGLLGGPGLASSDPLEHKVEVLQKADWKKFWKWLRPAIHCAAAILLLLLWMGLCYGLCLLAESQ